MKKIHFYLIRSYLPPFTLTLLIGMFIFFIIFIFVYIDEIAGKGVDNWTLTQLLFYSFISNLPTAAPLAVLLSSIMTMGNFAENYELAALKSSGMSLFAIMRPLIFLILFISIGIFLFSNYTMPIISLKAGRLLWDVRQKKPTFNIKPGIYNSGLENYRIKVNSKAEDGVRMKGIYIADHSKGQGNNVQLLADSGTIKTTKKGDFLVINIFNAVQYRQLMETDENYRTRPMLTMNFKQQEIKIDLSELKMQNTQEALFKSNYQMLNLNQLNHALDSFRTKEKQIKAGINDQISKHFTPLADRQNKNETKTHIKLVDYLKHFGLNEQNQIFDKALEKLRSTDSYINSTIEHELFSSQFNQIKFRAEWHKKLSLPFACLVLFFVGSPLGAIVRKGGLGMPVVISVILFIIYHVVKTSLEKSFLEGASGIFTGLWGSTFIFLPLGIWLTWMAANDSAIFEKSSYKFFLHLFQKKK
ncbi:MAG: LptF/LptG family permease [Bacteroidota bacterium]|jgi:lipopolysaccharide export system permease protein